LPPSVFAFAKQLEKQLKASKSFKQSGRKNKIVKKSAEVA
jgi:hypothetical protein